MAIHLIQLLLRLLLYHFPNLTSTLLKGITAVVLVWTGQNLTVSTLLKGITAVVLVWTEPSRGIWGI